jgi:RNA polymerase sigma factor (sigma-70 family)
MTDTNENLVASYQSGNKKSLANLLKLNKSLIFTLVKKYSNIPRYEALSICRYGFYKAVCLYNGQCKFSTYAYMCMSNKLRTYIKVNKKSNEFLIKKTMSYDLLNSEDQPKSPLISPEAYTDKRQWKKLLLKAKECLTEQELTIITHYYYHDLSLRQIAQKIDLSYEMVRQVLKKGIIRLRKKMVFIAPSQRP